MQRLSLRWLVLAAVLALAVEAVDCMGYWQWQRTSRLLGTDTEAGATSIARSWANAVPSVVHWSRGLSARQLVGARPSTIVAAMKRLGDLQTRWMPVEPEGFKNRGRAELLDDRLEEGLANLELALQRDPTSPYLLRLTALVLRTLGRPQESLERVADAEAIAPGFAHPEIEMTPEDQEWVRLEGLRRRLQVYPREQVGTLLQLAGLQAAAGHVDEARTTLSPVIEHPDAQLQLARWEIADGAFDSAAERAKELARRTSLPVRVRVQAWSLAAQALDAGGDPDAALDAAGEAMRLGPGSPEPYVALANLAQTRGDHQAALEHLRRAWGVAPTDIGILMAVASAADAAGRPADARLARERAAELKPDDPAVVAVLVEHHLRQRDYMEATMVLSKALDRFPTDARLLGLTEQLRREVSRFEQRGR